MYINIYILHLEKKEKFDSSYNMTFNALATNNYFSKTWYEGAILKYFLGVVAALSRKIYGSRVPWAT